MKALCDQMLGTLAKWLRLFGFDTFYANSEMEDEELLQVAKKEDRVIITRDKQLIVRGKKEKLPVIEVNTTDLDEQLNLVLKNVDIDQKAVLSRCSICNTILDEIEKSEVRNKVPEKIFENNEKFWFCSKCNKFYWMGSHYERILNKIEKIKST
ncbi:MAG: Mut7-C RNAse domain-containing protein [Euryarchaeota archaeon]|nr:Mut7-C RNAse domain-containing protein [Euryarchaeota archaeon]